MDGPGVEQWLGQHHRNEHEGKSALQPHRASVTQHNPEEAQEHNGRQQRQDKVDHLLPCGGDALDHLRAEVINRGRERERRVVGQAAPVAVVAGDAHFAVVAFVGQRRVDGVDADALRQPGGVDPDFALAGHLCVVVEGIDHLAGGQFAAALHVALEFGAHHLCPGGAVDFKAVDVEAFAQPFLRAEEGDGAGGL